MQSSSDRFDEQGACQMAAPNHPMVGCILLDRRKDGPIYLLRRLELRRLFVRSSAMTITTL